MTALLLLACWPGPLPDCPDCPANDDLDGDGYTPAQGDCDDGDGSIFPGAEEVCNGADDDCDGGVDVGAVDAPLRWADGDGDGWGAGEAEPVCDPGEGWAEQGGDCEDGDEEVHPEAGEICNNGVDDNCEGTDDGCALAGVLPLDGLPRLETDKIYALLGRSLASPGDLNGDGRDELLVGAPGWETLLNGAAFRLDGRAEWSDGAIDEVADGTLVGAAGGDFLGEAVVAGGGRIALRAVGALSERSGGYVYLLDADISGLTEDLDAVALARVEGREGEDLGQDMVMGPGGELAVSSDAQGYAGWYLAPEVSGAAEIADVGAALFGEVKASGLALLDLGGDGVLDLAVGQAALGVDGRVEAGAVALLEGPLGADRELSIAPALEGPDGGDRAGGALAALPDLDGDGLAELAVASPDGAGVTWLVSGAGEEGDLDDAAWLRLEGDPDAWPGLAMVSLDLNGDGAADLALGAPKDDRAGGSAGAVYVLYGPLQGGALSLEEAPLVLEGAESGDMAGYALAAGDLDGDGLTDLAVGAPEDAYLSYNAGAVLIVLGSGL